MVNNLIKLKELSEVTKAVIPEEIDEFSYSEIAADIKYKGGFSVLVLKIKNDYIITYSTSLKTWNANCLTPESVIENVKQNIEILKATKVIPS